MCVDGMEGKTLTCMMILRSAFPVRISYKAKVLSEPILARTDASARLKRTDVIVSVDVGRVRLEMAALLGEYTTVIRASRWRVDR